MLKYNFYNDLLKRQLIGALVNIVFLLTNVIYLEIFYLHPAYDHNVPTSVVFPTTSDPILPKGHYLGYLYIINRSTF